MRVITPITFSSDTPFSRASTATYYNASGILQTAAIDVVRVNYDPATLEPEGILIEDAATNLLTYSEQFDNVIWQKSNTSVTANGTTAQDGTLTMDKLIENTATGGHYCHVTRTATNETTTFSVFAKAGERTKIALIMSNFVSFSVAAAFDLGLGTVISVSAPNADYSSLSASIIHLGGGIYRCIFTTTKNSVNSTNNPQISLLNATDAINYTGDGVSGLYIWGAQLEIGESASSYIPTVATTVTRAADMLGDMVTSTVAEPDTGESAWDAATNYSLGNEVIRTNTHKKYINILAGADATLPEVDAALAEPTRWVEAGPTNRFAMFDTLRNTQTEATSPLSVVIVPGERVNSIGILAMEAEEITITVANAYEEIYSYTENLNTREVLNWYDYFFEPFSNTPAIVRFDLPPYTAGNITITLTSSTGTVKCGAVIVGNYTDIGRMEYGARISALNFSRIDREFDGTAVLVQRQTKPKVTGQLFFNKSQTNKILALKQTLNAVPTVWSGMDDDNTDAYFDGLLVLGIYKLFDVDIAYPENALLDLEIEEI
jgi:hypothetical protein